MGPRHYNTYTHNHNLVWKKKLCFTNVLLILKYSFGQTYLQETDMVIAPLTMTSEREEVIDFVAPYFDQSGISIGGYLLHIWA
jgi:hypothetical protein